MNIEARKTDNVIVLDLEGPMTLEEDTRKLRSILDSLLRKNERQFVLNMQDVSLMDCAGIGQLVISYRRVLERGGDLKLLNLNRRLHYLLRMMRLLNVIEAFENEEDAISSFRVRGTLMAEEARFPRTDKQSLLDIFFRVCIGYAALFGLYREVENAAVYEQISILDVLFRIMITGDIAPVARRRSHKINHKGRTLPHDNRRKIASGKYGVQAACHHSTQLLQMTVNVCLSRPQLFQGGDGRPGRHRMSIVGACIQDPLA